jgi:UDP-3-O-[3-hydroxymyristoyl] glucosamine N-acyltransferase
MARTLGELATLVGGKLRGDPTLPLSGAAPLSTAVAGEITLVDSPDRAKKLAGRPAAAVVVPAGVQVDLPSIEVDDVHAAFTRIVGAFRPRRAVTRVGVSPRAVISPSAKIGPNVDVYPGAVIGDDVIVGTGSIIHSGVQLMAGCRLGENVVVFPNAVLYEDTIVGPRSIIHAAAVLGAYGFGYRTVGGRHELTAQLGNVEIGADVEVGAGSTIDRGTYGPTRIGAGTKIDDQVMIGHNCSIGRHNLVCAQVGVAGSSSTGDYVVMAGQAGVRDHVHIGDRAVLMAKAGIMNDVPEGAAMFGVPATPAREQMQHVAGIARLPEMRKQLRELEAAVAELRRQIAAELPGDAGPPSDAEPRVDAETRSDLGRHAA